MMADILFPKWTLYAVIPSNPKIHNGNDLPRNMKCYSIWSESNLAFLPLAIISSVANDGAFLSQVILKNLSSLIRFLKCWKTTGHETWLDQIKQHSFQLNPISLRKWIAKDKSIISIKNWMSDVGYFFIHRPVVNLVIPVGPSAFHGSIVVHIPF